VTAAPDQLSWRQWFGFMAMVLVTLYPLCRWMADLKSRRRDWWLSYV